jgi:hypothetical protein
MIKSLVYDELAQAAAFSWEDFLERDKALDNH